MKLRFIGSLIKFFVYICIILIVAGTALFWFDTGSWLVLPLAQRAGNFFLDPMTLEIENINGSVREGYSVENLRLFSGDENLFALDYFSASPDWDLVLAGMEGVPFIKNLNLRGVSSDLDKVLTIANHFSSDEKKDEENKVPSDFKNLKINPANISIEDINFGTPYADLNLNALKLDDSGKLIFDAKIVSGENTMPLKTNALINFTSLKTAEIVSADLFIGEKGTGTIAGTLEPLNAKLYFGALFLEEFLKFAPPLDIKASGRIDGKIFVASENENKNIKVSGVLSMPRAQVMDIPFNFRLPFAWNGENFLTLTNAVLNTKAAALKLNASADVADMKFAAKGEAENISLNEIGSIFAPDLKLKGEGGYLNFDIETAPGSDFKNIVYISGNTKADITAEIPSVSAMNMKIIDKFKSEIKLNPGSTPKIAMNGEVFGGKLFARGEGTPDNDGIIVNPQAVISIINLDLNTLAKTFPAIAKSVKNLSGKVSLRARVSEQLKTALEVNSDKIAANGISLTGINANLNFDPQTNKAVLENLKLNAGKGSVTAYGNADIKSSIFNLNADVRNFEPKIIPELKQLKGIYNLRAIASGKYTDLNTINANANLSAKNIGYSSMNFGNIDVPISFSDNVLNIAESRASLPGGSLNFRGKANIKNISDPYVDISASTNGINLAEVFDAFNIQNKSMPVTGKVKGNLNVKGTYKTASVNASLAAENVKAGKFVNMPSALISANGNMKKITVKKLEAKINNADINGSGEITVNQKNLMNSAVNIRASLKKLALKTTLKNFMERVPVEGLINADASLKGTISQPQASLNITSPVYYGKTVIEDIALKLRSPKENNYALNAAARIGNFKPEVDINAKNDKGLWTYEIQTKPVDVNAAVEAQMPSMAGMAKGFANVKINGKFSTDPKFDLKPAEIKATANEIKVLDKIIIKNVNLPLVYTPAKNKLEMKKGTAIVSDGKVNSSLNVDTAEKTYTGKINIDKLDFGKLAGAFLPEGELIGKVDAEITTKGTFDMMSTSFANGKFSTTPGYLHKMAIIDRVTPTKKITFEKISGTFFWNGNDIFLNPGTGAKADAKEPLYRYFTVNGSAGLKDKGLKLICDGRFDLKILDRLLGAMKGAFQYVTGGLAKDVLRDAAGRVLGVKRRDFQNVSFTLANSWQQLRLLDLKITKPIEDFLPIDLLNKDEEKQKDDAQFSFKLKFPVGQGDTGSEEESAGDQFKQQLLDNLFNIVN